MANVPDTKENFQMCICANCPTYQAGACPKDKGEKLYCAKGKSACELANKGCICGGCPVWSSNKLTGYYYCKM
ncbi:MAG TPA: DUF2769 domain-containing protein [Candidatus Methylomirabilis sp.]|nr:DUF2769 domain-containing protein [Candidatus Methylomirabilis sp.]